ncbi:MAG: Sua5/YciO/YrdC/YwlC family protein, partial [Acidimicrobiia bacterium]|nr:Sua5/YciO/YrdC/YwlC family protein [Acidimicrobiia bacterium]
MCNTGSATAHSHVGGHTAAPVDAVIGRLNDSAATGIPTIERRRLVITGVVQGVGFRPFVHRLANRLHLTGTVTNSSARVVIEVAGVAELLDRFQQLLVDEAPPLASIESLIADRLDVEAPPVEGFTIVASDSGNPDESSGNRIFVAADTAPCEACRAEMLDPSNRRYRHPFISCTDCGPRFTIIESLPYDRPSTTMAGFQMCPACHDEYHDPSDRRFHAQPIACHDCGPTLLFRNLHPGRHSVSPEVHRTGEGAVGEEAVAEAARAVVDGGVLVVKGVGGFQLACDAGNDEAVAALRAWKRRPDKPLAILVADLDVARRLVELGVAEEELLTSPARPIVLARRRVDDDTVTGEVADGVAPTQPRLGVMLPPSPLHELLAAAVGRPLVLTSGNHSGAPMTYRDEQLADLLAGSEELGLQVEVGVLTHDRPIAVACDD